MDREIEEVNEEIIEFCMAWKVITMQIDTCLLLKTASYGEAWFHTPVGKELDDGDIVLISMSVDKTTYQPKATINNEGIENAIHFECLGSSSNPSGDSF